MPRRRPATPARLALRSSTLLLALASLATGARAQSYSQAVSYMKTAQSMWGTNAAPPVSASWAYDVSWNKSASIGGIAGSARAVIVPGECVPYIGCTPDVYGDTRTGAAYTASTSGSSHFGASAQFSGGSVDIGYKANTSVTVLNNAGVYHPGERVTLRSAWTPAGGSSIMTTAPTYSADVDFGFSLAVGATGTVCSFGAGCDDNGGDFFSFDTGVFELAALNRNGTGANRIFGLNAPALVYGKPVTPGDIVFGATRALSLTAYDGDASTYSGLGSGLLQARGSEYLMNVSLDPVALAANYVGMGSTCLLSCSALGFGYDIQGTRFGPTFGYQQDFAFQPPTSTTTYTFDTAVQWRTVSRYVMVADTVPCTAVLAKYANACKLALDWIMQTPMLVSDPWSAATRKVTVPTGVDIDFLYPPTNGAPLGVQTSFDATGKLRNTSRLQVTPQFSYTLLSVTTPDGTIGPVYKKTYRPGTQNIGAFYDATFDVNLGAQSGASFLLAAADPNAPLPGYQPGESLPPMPPSELTPLTPLATPEPSTVVLLGGGLLALAAVGRRRSHRDGERLGERQSTDFTDFTD